MKIARFFLVLLFFVPVVSGAETLSLDDALRATYTACIGIDNSLTDLKKMAGINTAITGVGTGLGVGATVVGIVKEKTDKQLDDLFRELVMLEDDEPVPTQNDIENWLAAYHKSANISASAKSEIDTLNNKSKKLGNWRTGLMAGNTATNVAGAIISSKNRVDDDLQTQINDCKSAVNNLQNAILQAKVSGEDITEANTIYNTCKEYNYVDISKINERGKGATISSAVGAATGITGTITSAVANSDSVRSKRNADGTRTDKEKNLNTASNVLAGASTVASATATVFNATQIKAIKDVANVAVKCTEALK